MKATTLETAELLDVLPDEDALLVNTIVKKLVVAWDPDFSKVTAREKALLEKSDSEMKNGQFVYESEAWS